MYFQIGNYRHPSAEIELISTRQTQVDQAGRPVFYTDRWSIRGQLQYEGTSLLAAQQVMMQFYRAENIQIQTSAGLYYDNGIATCYFWNAFNTLGGFRCLQGPDFPTGNGQQWVNCRDYQIILEADFSSNLQSNTTEWVETVTINGGGGQRLVGLENRYDKPIIQRVSRATPVYYTQAGKATGRYFYPTPPPAIAPQFLNSPNCYVNRQTPTLKIAGAYGTQTDWVVNWHYEMILDTYVPASPVPWRGS